MRRVVALLTAVTAAGSVACSLPEKKQFPPLGCYMQPLPPLPASLTIRGTVVDTGKSTLTHQTVVSGALVEVFVDGGSYAAPTRTGDDGSFVLPVTLPSTIHSLYLKVSADSQVPSNPYLDTFLYPSTEIPTEDLDDLRIQLLTAGEVTTLMGSSGPMPSTPPIILAITVVNCNDEPQAHATVSTEPKADAILYLVDRPDGPPEPDPKATSTDPQEGTAIAVLVPTSATTAPASVTVGATMPSETNATLILRSHRIPAPRPGTVIQTSVQP